MKKYLILLLMSAAVGFTSCSDDDEETDRIVGNWILESVDPSTLFNPQACTNNSTVQINGDNTLTATFYFEQNNCDGVTGNGSWEKNGSTYQLEFPEIGTFNGTVTYPSPDRMIFTSDSSTVLTFQRQL